MCYLVGQITAELFVSGFSLLIVLAGLTVLFLGWNFFRALLFPLAFLLLMIPIPAIVFNQVTFLLQLLASNVACMVLPWMGVPVMREGNVIMLTAIPLEVADAVSGIRSLISLATLAMIYGYLMERRVVVRVLLALASIPIAVAANSLRIVGTGLLVQYSDPDKAQWFFHEFQGWLVFVASLAMLYLLHRIVGVSERERGSELKPEDSSGFDPYAPVGAPLKPRPHLRSGRAMAVPETDDAEEISPDNSYSSIRIPGFIHRGFTHVWSRMTS
ncbi:MAG: exosortase/archaeosortase family protein [Candidatus Sulfotelmatobacter sp.]